MRYALAFLGLFFGIIAMLSFSSAEETEKNVSAETQETQTIPITPTVEKESEIDPIEDCVKNSRQAWHAYRAALRRARENLVQSLELAETDLKGKLKNLQLDARETLENAKVKDACEVSRMKWRETLALSEQALEDFCKANRTALKNYCEARHKARFDRNAALETNR